MRHATIAATMILSLGMFGSAGAGEHTWYPADIDIWDTDVDPNSPVETGTYTPLEQASQPWDICVSIPHMADPYWMAVNYGIADEARRLGVNMQLFEAGGYVNLDTQISQLEGCVSRGADAIVLGAISYDGLNRVIDEIVANDIPVVDFINGVSSDKVAARSLVSFYELGHMAGSYLAEQYPEGSDPVKVGWFPGPTGAGWSEDGNRGFKDAVEGSAVEIVATEYGDANQRVQMELVENVLQAHRDVDYIIGATTTAEAGANLLRRQGRLDEVRVMPYYYSVGVHRGIVRGHILAAPTDQAVIQSRIAMDQAVRVLEGEDVMTHVGPSLFVVGQDNIDDFDARTSLAPDDWSPVFRVRQ